MDRARGRCGRPALESACFEDLIHDLGACGDDGSISQTV
jgi:hypothetical protein